MYKLTIPRRFAEDREARGLSNGSGRWMSRGFKTSLTREEYEDLLSDADAYANGGYQNGMGGLVRSARLTLERLRRVTDA